MKKILLILLVIAVAVTISTTINAQGCVAIKSDGSAGILAHPMDSNNHSAWQFSTSMRYFKSFRHFSGTEENKQRLVDNSEVINHQTSFDLALTRIISDRWSVTIDVPVLANTRSSLYEHGLVNGTYIKKERHSMHSFGVGDIRIAAYRWLLDPQKSYRANIQLGLGIKLPTGDYNYKDYWYNVGPNGTKELRPVDQSIQLGDGGTGFTTEVNAFYNFSRNFGMYGNFYYLINPREQNGVRTYRETLSPTLANESIMSVPDQYMFRAGFNYSFNNVKGLAVSAGARLEGIPVHDLVGGSGDFRRPGYIWSVEPTATYSVKHWSFFASVPVAVVRNRTQSVTDKANSITFGKFVRGDAAFADYVINTGFAYRF
ncbi:MAG: hypothetical protein ACTHJ5_13150 [Ilyomonas sp.]